MMVSQHKSKVGEEHDESGTRWGVLMLLMRVLSARRSRIARDLGIFSCLCNELYESSPPVCPSVRAGNERSPPHTLPFHVAAAADQPNNVAEGIIPCYHECDHIVTTGHCFFS